MSQEPEDDLEPEYEFSEVVRGKYHQRYKEAMNATAPPEQLPLGSRIARRFAEVGLSEEIPELRGESPRVATVESEAQHRRCAKGSPGPTPNR